MSSTADLHHIDVNSPIGRAEIRDILLQADVRSNIVDWMMDTLANLTSCISWVADDRLSYIDANAELEDKILTLEEQFNKVKENIKKLHDDIYG